MLLAAVMLVCATLYTWQLGTIAFLGKDEPKNAQTAREMMERDDWVITTLEGEPWFDKPILYYWTARVAYRVVGVGELGARLGPALAALLSVFLTYLLGRRVMRNDSAGVLAAFVLGTGLLFWHFARTSVTDALLSCFVTGTLVAYLFARDGVRPVLNLHLMYACAAMATLAKGPVGIVLPGMIIVTDRILSRKWSLRGLHLVTGTAVFLAVAGPWYYLVMVRSEGQFFRDFILHNNLERFQGTAELPHAGPFYYYIPFLLLGPFPWAVFLPTAVLRLARGFRDLEQRDREQYRFLLSWIALPVIFFSMAGSKLPSYLLPILPAVAVILTREIRELLRLQGSRVERPFQVTVALFALLSSGIAVALLHYARTYETYLLEAVTPLCVVLVVSAVGTLVAAAIHRRHAAVACIGVSAVLVPLSVVQWGLPPVEHYASAREIALQAMARQPEPGTLFSFRFYDNSFFFYTDATVERLWERRHIENRVDKLGTALCFVRDEDLAHMKESKRFAAEELGHVGDIHLLRLESRRGKASRPAPDAGAVEEASG